MNTLLIILVALVCVAVFVYFLFFKGQKNPTLPLTSTTTLPPPDPNGCALYNIVVTDENNFLSYISCDGDSIQDSQLPLSLEKQICCKTGTINGSGMDITYLGQC
jgi:hypothetical protein